MLRLIARFRHDKEKCSGAEVEGVWGYSIMVHICQRYLQVVFTVLTMLARGQPSELLF